jgi:hypothetical protein
MRCPSWASCTGLVDNTRCISPPCLSPAGSSIPCLGSNQRQRPGVVGQDRGTRRASRCGTHGSPSFLKEKGGCDALRCGAALRLASGMPVLSVRVSCWSSPPARLGRHERGRLTLFKCIASA